MGLAAILYPNIRVAAISSEAGEDVNSPLHEIMGELLATAWSCSGNAGRPRFAHDSHPTCQFGTAPSVVSNTATLHLVVLLQVGTAFVTPTDGQEYDPTDGAVTVPIDIPDAP